MSVNMKEKVKSETVKAILVKKPLLPRQIYYSRLLKGFVISTLLIAGSLLLGMAGYHFFAGLGFVDSLLNASMILTGMGPVDQMKTTGGKLFASFYAIYSGVAFLSITAILLGPAFHRFLHRFHLEINEDEDNSKE